MDQRVRDYLIKAHNKVIAHYHQVLEARSLAQPERERIQERLAGIEVELAKINGSGALDPMHLVQSPPIGGRLASFYHQQRTGWDRDAASS